MPSVVMSVTPALLPNPVSQSSLSGVQRERSPELDGDRSTHLNPESPDSAEESMMATSSQNEDSSKASMLDNIDNIDPKVSSYQNQQEDQCSPIMSPVKSESASSPSFASADSGISTSPLLGARDELREYKSDSMSTRPVSREGNEAPSNHPGAHHYPHSDDCADGEDRNSNIAGRNLNLITCQDCGLICAGQSHYQVHIRSHTGERPFKCTICGVAFTQKGNLRRHYKIHSDEKPFQCPICSYRCRRRDALNGHMRIHSDVRPYRCVYCARSYKSRQSLKEHEFQCPYKKDPVLPAADDSPGGNTASETQRSLSEPGGHSPGYRNEDNIENTAHSASSTPGLLPMDPSKYNYLRSVAGNFKSSSTMASIFAQALTANAMTTSGKRKSANPQKIPRYKDFPANHPLMQLQSPMLHQNPFGLRENDRPGSSSSSPMSMPTIPLPFIPTNMLSSVLQQHHLRQAAVNATFQAKSQQQALDFSSGRPRDSKMQDNAAEPAADSRNVEDDDYYDEKYYSNNAKPSGSAKRKRPKYLNERYVNAEFPIEDSKRSRISSPDKERSHDYQTDKTAEDAERRNRESPTDATANRHASSHPADVLRVFRVGAKGGTSKASPDTEELKSYFCKHCRCLFLDEVMYAIHAGCHGFQDPFECNICGFRACDRFQFQSHMTRCEHSSSAGVSSSKSPNSPRWQFPIQSAADEDIENTPRDRDVGHKRVAMNLEQPRSGNWSKSYHSDRYDNGSD